MSGQSDATTSKPPRPVNRWGVGFMTIIQVVCFALILIAANYLSFGHFAKHDWSEDEDYTLAPSTARYLTSDAVQKRKDPIKWIIAFRRSSDYYGRVRALAEEYARLSNNKITLQIVDPVRSPDTTQRLAAQYGIYDPNNEQIARKDLVIIDARTAEEIADAQSDKQKAASSHVRIISTDVIVNSEVDPKTKKLRPVSFQGEDALTAGLVAAIEGHARKMYYLADKSRISAEGDNSPWKTLVRTLAFQNIQLEPITIADKSEIPEDASAVALVSPKYDFGEEEMALLERYWGRPRSAILVILNGADEVPPRLRTFLRTHGVTPRRDRVITNSGGQTITTVRAAFEPGIEFTRDLAGQATLFEGATSSLEVRGEEVMEKSIFPLPLIKADPGFWGETKFGAGKEAFDKTEDNDAPLWLSAAVLRGSGTDDRFADQMSRMLVMTNVDFLKPENLREENLDFLASTSNWLVGREELAGIGSRSLRTYKLPLLDAQVSFINRVNLFFIPAAFLVIAGFVWSSRRA